MSIAASIIASTLNAGTPLLIAAAGIVIHEKSGVLNLGIEGIMLMGAVTGFTVTLSTGSFALGFLAGAGVGILLGLLFAFFTLGMHANQYAAGLALSLFGAGLSAFIGKPLQGQALAERSVSGIPGLENIPFFGEAFFSQHILVYGAWVLIAAVWYFLSERVRVWCFALSASRRSPLLRWVTRYCASDSLLCSSARFARVWRGLICRWFIRRSGSKA